MSEKLVWSEQRPTRPGYYYVGYFNALSGQFVVDDISCISEADIVYGLYDNDSEVWFAGPVEVSVPPPQPEPDREPKTAEELFQESAEKEIVRDDRVYAEYQPASVTTKIPKAK